jgi:hypothetical protein
MASEMASSSPSSLPHDDGAIGPRTRPSGHQSVAAASTGYPSRPSEVMRVVMYRVSRSKAPSCPGESLWT